VEAGPDARLATCGHCHAPLVVVRTTTSVFTDAEPRQKELDRIDREWEDEKERKHTCMTATGRCTWGQQHWDALRATGACGVVFLVGIALLRHWGGAPKDVIATVTALALIFGVLFVALAALCSGKAWAYWRAGARYRERRAAAEQPSAAGAAADVRTLPVNCNRCGAAVAAGPDTRHVTCGRCRIPLVVVRAAGSVSTESAELDRIDREWAEEKERDHCCGYRLGVVRTNDEMVEGMVGIAAIFWLALLVCIPFMVADRRTDILPVFVALAVFPAFLLAHALRKARRFWRAEAAYRERRADAARRWADPPPG
jgi:hypothetical protein